MNNENNIKDSVMLILFKLAQIDLWDCEFSTRARNCLIRSGIDNLGKLLVTPEEQLYKIRNMGKKTFNEIYNYLYVDKKFRYINAKIEKLIDNINIETFLEITKTIQNSYDLDNMYELLEKEINSMEFEDTLEEITKKYPIQMA